MSDVSGSWLGTYWQNGSPTRFEASLVQSGSQVTGRILDDGYMGEAQMEGEAIGRSIRFAKRYLARPDGTILYVGTITEDGNFMQGEWTIPSDKPKTSGTWEAHRGEDPFMAELQSRLSAREPVGVR